MTQEEVLEKVRFHTNLRGLSERTCREYCATAKRYQKHYDKSADELGIADIQAFLHYLSAECKNSSGSVNRVNSGLRFLYPVALDETLNFSKIPFQRNIRKFPEILSREDVAAVISACDNLRDKTMLMTVYGAGLRVSEVIRLRVQDIDSTNMQIYIQNGKGGKDRYALLSKANLDILREYWLAYQPKEYLFLSRNHRPMTPRAAQDIFTKAKNRAGIEKSVSTHTLRHCFATHLLEDGVSIYHIKQLLGHAHISTTCFYLHLMKIRDLDVISPLDRLYSGEADA